MRISMNRSSHLLSYRLGLFVSEEVQHSTSLFFLDSCSFDKAACCLSDSSGRIVSAPLVGSSPAVVNEIRTHKFEIRTLPDDHGKLLQCGLSTSHGAVMLEKLLLWEVKALHVSALSVLVAGQLAKLSVFSDSLPEAQHRCFIESLGSQRIRNLTLLSTSQSKTIDSTNRTLVRVRSGFSFNVSMADRNADIVCKGTAGSERKETAWTGIISEISEPCETAVDLGPEKFWLVGQIKLVQVISKRCSIWNVSHSCWLKLNADAAVSTPLQKVQGEFNSTHELRVVEAMARQNWQVLCSVNQSGVEHTDSESSLSSAPAVFSQASKSTLELALAYVSNSQSVVHVHAVDQNKKQKGLLPVYSINCSVAADEASTELRNISSTEWHGLLKVKWNGSSVNVCCSSHQAYTGLTVFESLQCKSLNQQPVGKDDIGVSALLAAGLTLAFLVAICLSIWAFAATASAVSCDRKNEESFETVSDCAPASAADGGTSEASDGSSLQDRHRFEFVTVTNILLAREESVEDSSSDGEEDLPQFTEAAGHYDTDGCTFVNYSAFDSHSMQTARS
uniref:Ig-like domain-containing protein n=1 Tax=Macrostomum lignano TaxID=282301 RepID=A0A1I8J7H9_9PLAT